MLAKNLNLLMEMQGLRAYQVAAEAKIAPKTFYSMLKAGHDARLINMEKVAAVFGLSAWQLMAVDLAVIKPPARIAALALLQAYSSADDAGRQAIMQVAEIVPKRPPEEL